MKKEHISSTDPILQSTVHHVGEENSSTVVSFHFVLFSARRFGLLAIEGLSTHSKAKTWGKAKEFCYTCSPIYINRYIEIEDFRIVGFVRRKLRCLAFSPASEKRNAHFKRKDEMLTQANSIS